MVDNPGVKRLAVEALPALETPYLDSSVFLAHIKKETNPTKDGKPRFEITKRIFDDAEARKFKIHTSTLTLAEVRRIKHAKKEVTKDELEEINGLFEKYLENEWIALIELNREIGEKAQSLGAEYNISPTDAVHVATALFLPCNVLLVWDKPSLTDKLPPEIEGVKILEPYWEGTPRMETKAPKST